MKNLYLSFNGFYCSKHDDIIDNMISNYFEEDDDLEKYDIDYKKIHVAYSKMFLSYFEEWLKDEEYIKKSLRFKYLSSPKFYNYETDKIIFSMCDSDIKSLSKKMRKNSDFCGYITEKTKNYDGYISFYNFHDVYDNKDDIFITFVMDYLCDIFEDELFYDYFDRQNGHELLYKMNKFYQKAV